MTTLLLKTHPIQFFQHSIKASLVSLFDTLQLWFDRNHQREQLSQLSEYQLKDIGLTKADVSRELSKPFWK